MNDYMKALHQRFYREPDFSEMEEDIENTRQEVRDCLDKLQRRRLMHLVDTQNLLREETSLASFTAGFKLAWGLSKELEADGLYSFDEEETERVCRRSRKGGVSIWESADHLETVWCASGRWPLGGPHRHRPQGKRRLHISLHLRRHPEGADRQAPAEHQRLSGRGSDGGRA